MAAVVVADLAAEVAEAAVVRVAAAAGDAVGPAAAVAVAEVPGADVVDATEDVAVTAAAAIAKAVS